MTPQTIILCPECGRPFEGPENNADTDSEWWLCLNEVHANPVIAEATPIERRYWKE